jgi:hypothetical protein
MRLRLGRLLTLLSLAVVLSGSAVAFSEDVFATDYCGSSEASLFLYNGNFGSIGSQARVLAPNHSLVSCGGSGETSVAVNTVGLLLTSDATNWVEVGYKKYLSCGFGCSENYKVFGEWGFSGTTGGPYYYANVTSGTVPTFKAVIVDGTYNWTIYWDRNGGVNFTLLATYNNLCCHNGYAYGEATRKGKSGTDNVDHHYSLQYKNTSLVWNYYGSLLCWNDTDADYQWGHVSNTEFRVDAGPNYC